MNKRFLCIVILMLPVLIQAQETSAIQWTTNLSWQQIKQKAKKENKYIFVDAYTTWCKPCREMDVKVYTVDSVGEFLNKEFISVKVQMDQTKNDDAFVRSWYKTAGYMTKEYNLNAYPTMLFFTPSGEIATKEVGYKDAPSLIEAAKNSKDPSKQYYVLLKNYKKGNLDDAAKRSLIKTAKELNDSANYQALRISYFSYLHALPKEKLYTKENIEFIASIISRKSHVVFDLFYPDGSAVDKVMEKNGYARKVVDDVIMKEKISSVFNGAVEAKQEPDWNSIYKSIAKDYNDEYADRNVMAAKMNWYWANEDALNFANTLNNKIEKYGADTTTCSGLGTLNNQAALIWENLGATAKPDSKAITELKRVCKWMEIVVRRAEFGKGWCYNDWPLYMDTYASLLYKVGRTAEAIKWEENAIAKVRETIKDPKEQESFIKLFEENLAKMKKGEPNWPIAAN